MKNPIPKNLLDIENKIKPFDYFFQLSNKISTLDWEKELFIFGKVTKEF
jgi:hypothetical protein